MAAIRRLRISRSLLTVLGERRTGERASGRVRGKWLGRSTRTRRVTFDFERKQKYSLPLAPPQRALPFRSEQPPLIVRPALCRSFRLVRRRRALECECIRWSAALVQSQRLKSISHRGENGRRALSKQERKNQSQMQIGDSLLIVSMNCKKN